MRERVQACGAQEASVEQRRPVVVKIGGNALGPEDTTFRDAVALQRSGVPVVIVHGGGATITKWLEKQGVATTFVRGRRVTDEAGLEVVTAVLCGLTNKALVAAINAVGGRAVGISGVDAGTVLARVEDPDLGRVGEVESVAPALVRHLLDGGFIPVIAPVSLESPAASGRLLNVNADTVAAAVAGALNAERLVFLTDVAGGWDKDKKVIPSLTTQDVLKLIRDGVISGGMIPKVEACTAALAYVGAAQIADGRQPGALPQALSNKTGTLVLNGKA